MNTNIAPQAPLALNLNGPGSFWHRNIFYISIANLVLIGVMVVIFGAALLIPFSGGRRAREPAPEPGGPEAGQPGPESAAAEAEPDAEDARMWTARVRRRALAVLPPGKLLPDRQPAYVASWIYVFGVASVAALAVAIVSGFALALGDRTGGTTTRSGTSSTACTCGAWSCSWPCS